MVQRERLLPPLGFILHLCLTIQKLAQPPPVSSYVISTSHVRSLARQQVLIAKIDVWLDQPENYSNDGEDNRRC